MVTLTNQTTSSASVTDVGVSSASQTNTQIEQKTLTFGNQSTPTTAFGIAGEGIIAAPIHIDYPIALSFVTAFLYTTVSFLNANFVAVLYRRTGRLFGESVAVSSSSTITTTSLASYTVSFSGEKVTAGDYFLAIHADSVFFMGYTALNGSYSATSLANYVDVPATITSYSPLNGNRAMTVTGTSLGAPLVTSGNSLEIAGFDSTNTTSSTTTLNTISGTVVTDFQGGKLVSFYAYIDPLGTVTGETVAGIYINGTLVAQSDVFAYSDFSANEGWHEFTFSNSVYLPSGSLFLVLHSNSALTVERKALPIGSPVGVISRTKTYSGTLPENISVSGTSVLAPQIYIKYQPNLSTNQSPKNSTWNQLSTTWAGTTETWGDLVDYTQMTNL